MPEARVLWTRGTQMVATSGSGHAVVLDTPATMGGGGTGASPMEMLLVAQAGCTAMDVIHILRDKMRKNLLGLEVEAVGQRAEQVPKVYTEVEVTYRLRGESLSEKDVRRAIQLSAEKYCSVSLMVARSARLVLRYSIEDPAGSTTHEGFIDSGALTGE